jgi:hypothetical protein
MATPKQITLYDIGLKRIYLERVGSNLEAIQEWQFLDDQGKPITELGVFTHEINVPITSIPSNILTALQAIQTYVYNQILASEGMT